MASEIRDPDTEAAVDGLSISVHHLFITAGTICDLLMEKGLMTKDEWSRRRAMMTERYFKGMPVPPEFREPANAE